MEDGTKKILKYGGMACTAIGAGAMYLAGSTESSVTAIVAGVFVVGAIVVNIIKS